MINKHFLQQLRKNELIKGEKSTEQEFNEYENSQEHLDYMIVKIKHTTDAGSVRYIYEKYQLSDLDEAHVRLLLEFNNTKSLKRIEKYMHFFYILAIISLVLSGIALIALMG